MIEAFLGKIASFLERDFLFASFLPAVLFLVGVTATLAGVLGFDAVLAGIESWTALQKSTIAAVAVLFTFLFALLLYAMRTAFVCFWSGESSFPLHAFWGFQRLGEHLNRQRFLKLRAQAEQLPQWEAIYDDFNDRLALCPDFGLASPSARSRGRLLVAARRLRQRRPLGQLDPNIARQLDRIIIANQIYGVERLGDANALVNRALRDWKEVEAIRIQSATYDLDRRYGTLATIRPTALGNAIQAYYEYSYKRYKIEAKIFWPRLQSVVKPKYLSLVQDPRILLDFSLAMASLSGAYGLMALLLLPWLWDHPPLWIPLSTLGFSSCFFFYRLSISAALELGEMVRSCFDLFRLDLMHALGLRHPATSEAERDQWEEFSRLATYGGPVPFLIRPRQTP